jgi:hypothetical protein
VAGARGVTYCERHSKSWIYPTVHTVGHIQSKQGLSHGTANTKRKTVDWGRWLQERGEPPIAKGTPSPGYILCPFGKQYVLVMIYTGAHSMLRVTIDKSGKRGFRPLPGHFDPGIIGCFKSDNRRFGVLQGGGPRGFCANARALGAGLRA